MLANKEAREQVAELNAQLFGSDDPYTDINTLANYDIEVFDETTDDGTIIIAYLIYEESDEMLEGLRSGVHPEYQGQGWSKKLYKKMITKAKRKDKIYYTYTSMNNFASINSHVQCGMRITKFINGWVTMSFEPKKSVSLE